MSTYSPAAASALIGISISSLRNWCREFATQLSEGATPPTGTERKLTTQDVAILQRVKELRAQGMATEDIKATLLTEGVDSLQPPYIDSAIAPQPHTITTVKPPTTDPQPIDLYTAIIAHTTALQARMDAMQAQQDANKQDSADRVTLVAVGFLAGVGVALFALGAIWLFG